MSVRSLGSLCLVLVLAGCGAQELKSPECALGQPVVASGRIVLDKSVSAADVSRVELGLAVLRSEGSTLHSAASLEAPVDFPVAFTLCADLASVDPSADLFVTATARRSIVRDAPVSVGWLLDRDAIPAETPELTLTTSGCQSCGPACDPMCAFTP